MRRFLPILILLMLLATPALSTLTDNGDLTITDSETGLLWQKETGPRKNYADADTYCTSATIGGYADWRLPLITELEGLIDPIYTPQMSPLFQHNRSSLTYWSGTTVPPDIAQDYVIKDRAYNVYFVKGQTGHGPKRTSYRVRCVLDSPPGCETLWQTVEVTWQGVCIAWQ